MSQIDYYYGQNPQVLLPHQGGLKAWGIVLIVFGALSALFAVLALAFVVMITSNMVPRAQRQDPLALLAGVGVYAVAAVVLIWLGIGSLKGQRWVRPLVIVANSLIISSAVISLIPLSLSIFRVMQRPPQATSLAANAALLGLAGGGCFAVCFMIGLPAGMLWFYSRSSVQITLDVLDPHRHWTDRCPLPVLGWAVTCVILGVMFAASALHGIFPCFNAVLAGTAAYTAIAAMSACLIVGGILSYLQNPVGWLISIAAVIVLAASYDTFFFLGDQHLLMNLTLRNLPIASRRAAEPFAGYSVISPALMYIAATAYAVWIRRRFREPVAVPDFPAQ
jgi:hypothetical protein